MTKQIDKDLFQMGLEGKRKNAQAKVLLAEYERRLDLYPEMLAALKTILSNLESDNKIVNPEIQTPGIPYKTALCQIIARQLIAKCEGKHD